MERIYYDIVDIFAKDLEKNLNRSIEIDKKEKEIKIEEEIIRYEEKDIGVRSFSVPYFVKNQTIVKYDGTDKELINKIEAICTAYTDKEIEAIEETMPILKKYSEERKKNLEGVAIIWRDHFLEENVGLLTSMVRMWVKPEDVLAIDKGDSTKHREEITATFKKLGYQVDVLDNTAVANDILIEDGKRLIKDFIDNRKDKKIVILDDGAIVSRILTLHNYENVEAFVELTVTGLKRIGELKENELPYPVLNVAKSKLKRFITYKEIANTIFTRSIELLAGEKLVGRTVIQLGYGDLGEVLADRYSQYGAMLHYFYKLSEDKFNQDLFAFATLNRETGRYSFNERDYLRWLDACFSNELHIMKKSTERAGGTRNPFQAELAFLKKLGFIRTSGNRAAYRVGVGLEIDWPQVQNSLLYFQNL